MLSQERVPSFMEAKFALAKRVVFQPLKTRIGLEEAKLFSTSAAPIGRDVLEFFASIDVVIWEVYGQSGGHRPHHGQHRRGRHRLGTVGRPCWAWRCSIADDGEILVQGSNVCLGYHKDPAATRSCSSGRLAALRRRGELDAEGFLTSPGARRRSSSPPAARRRLPPNIEELLKAIPPVGQAVVVGDRRNYLVALVRWSRTGRRACAGAGWPEDVATLVADPRLPAAPAPGIRAGGEPEAVSLRDHQAASACCRRTSPSTAASSRPA